MHVFSQRIPLLFVLESIIIAYSKHLQVYQMPEWDMVVCQIENVCDFLDCWS